jgi:hypothetical protein
MLGHKTVQGPPPVGGHRALAIDAGRLLAPSRATRALAWFRHAQLDREIATGADLAASPLLAARAAQLASPRRRAQIAEGLELAASVTEEPRSRFRTLPRREAIRDNRDQLIELARALRADGAAYARGIALLELVLTDGTGPAYTDRGGAALRRQLRLARDSLGR